MTALKADNLTCSIGRRVIVSGIDLDVQPGTMTALVGVNGVGKSTLMRRASDPRRRATWRSTARISPSSARGNGRG